MKQIYIPLNATKHLLQHNAVSQFFPAQTECSLPTWPPCHECAIQSHNIELTCKLHIPTFHTGSLQNKVNFIVSNSAVHV